MAAAKESLPRASAGGSQPIPRQSNSKHHAHSLSVGSINPAHRVSRRKSTSASNASSAAVSAALQVVDQDNSGIASRKSGKSQTKTAFAASLPASSGFDQAHFASGVSLPRSPTLIKEDQEEDEDSITDDKTGTEPRMRRASEGTPKMFNHAGRRHAGVDLRCDVCGKAYKHSSCLYKHKWEHTPEWQLTSKFLISKHQQVQLLEAASVLVAMNHGPSDENSINSPIVSGTRSDSVSGMSSSEDSPSPRLDSAAEANGFDADSNGLRTKRFSSNSSAYSRSYESSVFSEGRGHNVNGHHRQWSTDHNGRPTTSGTSVTGSLTDDELAEQTAAASLLSCSYGTATSGTANQPTFSHPFDVPPVPPVPARFQTSKDGFHGTPSDIQLSGSGSTIRGGSHGGVASYDSFVRGERPIEDVEMADHDDTSVSANGHTAHYYHEEDEGMFGRMDE